MSHLYHVTFSGRLASIAERGLRANQGRSIGGAGYDGHRKNRVFFTSGEGVAYWFNKATDFAEHNCENVLEEGCVPVVLRYTWTASDDEDGYVLHEDPHGMEDAHAPAYFVEKPFMVPPSDVKVWDGAFWQPVNEVEVDAEQGVWWENDGDADEGGYWHLKGVYAFDHGPSPLLPPEVLP